MLRFCDVIIACRSGHLAVDLLVTRHTPVHHV